MLFKAKRNPTRTPRDGRSLRGSFLAFSSPTNIMKPLVFNAIAAPRFIKISLEKTFLLSRIHLD